VKGAQRKYVKRSVNEVVDSGEQDDEAGVGGEGRGVGAQVAVVVVRGIGERTASRTG